LERGGEDRRGEERRGGSMSAGFWLLSLFLITATSVKSLQPSLLHLIPSSLPPPYKLQLINPTSPLFPELKAEIVDIFGIPASTEASLSTYEEMFRIPPAPHLFDAYSNSVARREVGLGLEQRIYMPKPSDPLCDAPLFSTFDHIADYSSTSLILGVTNSSEHLLAAVELRLQPEEQPKAPVALLSVMHALTGRRPAARPNSSSLQPYLCNLFVIPEHRSAGLARALVRSVSHLALRVFQGYDNLFLHVDGDNAPAVSLYESEGFLLAGPEVRRKRGAPALRYYKLPSSNVPLDT
jgi:GNAT superfamily N-acetyltransferase